jgi:phosphatidate phosphatase PAH1
MEQHSNIHRLSPLSKTWIFDIDGTIAKHNGYKLDGKDSLLDGAAEFFNSIPKDDMIILLTSRTNEYRTATLEFLKCNNIRFDHIIFGAPYGERILINDRKPSGLDMSIAIDTERDKFMTDSFIIDESL